MRITNQLSSAQTLAGRLLEVNGAIDVDDPAPRDVVEALAAGHVAIDRTDAEPVEQADARPRPRHPH